MFYLMLHLNRVSIYLSYIINTKCTIFSQTIEKLLHHTTTCNKVLRSKQSSFKTFISYITMPLIHRQFSPTSLTFICISSVTAETISIKMKKKSKIK